VVGVVGAVQRLTPDFYKFRGFPSVRSNEWNREPQFLGLAHDQTNFCVIAGKKNGLRIFGLDRCQLRAEIGITFAVTFFFATIFRPFFEVLDESSARPTE
jgi:hypothetical protein